MFGLNEFYGGGGIESVVVPEKTTDEFAIACWSKWPKEGDWPTILDAYEAAAYLRISYWTILRLCRRGRDNKAVLAHQRFGTCYRIRRSVLDTYGAVQGR